MKFKTYWDKKNTPFLILHGWGGSSESWKKVWEMLWKDFFVIIPDIPCAKGDKVINRNLGDKTRRLEEDKIGWQDKNRITGLKQDKNNKEKNNLSPKSPQIFSSPCDKVYTLDDYTDLIKSFIDELWLENFVLLWHSNGWAIASKLVINYPNLKIKKLILNNSAWIRKDRKRSLKRRVFWVIAKIVKPIFSLPWMWKVRNLFYRAIGGHDYLEAEKNPNKKQTYLNMINSDLQENYKDINIPTLLIWWENDTYTPLVDGQKIHNLIKNSKLVIIKDVRHGIHLQKPDELVKVILENNL